MKLGCLGDHSGSFVKTEQAAATSVGQEKARPSAGTVKKEPLGTDV